MSLLKKGAMFGLDARIALAIFGALSVISGASLYSAIQDSKVTSIITQMNEVGKAWESYYLDTGENLPRNSSDKASIYHFALGTTNLMIDPGINNWQGPYFQTTNYSPTRLVSDDGYGIYMMELTKDVDWGDWIDGVCSTGRRCYTWVRFDSASDVFSESIKQAIDAKIDNSDGADKGNFRWDLDAINLLYSAVQNPVD